MNVNMKIEMGIRIKRKHKNENAYDNKVITK